MRRRARVDRNHKAITDALRGVGWHVVDASRLGHGFPDLIALRAGRAEFIEVKDGSKAPSDRKLSDDERKVHRDFLSAGVPVRVLLSVDEAVRL